MKTRLKAWVRYDGMGRVIPGGPVLSLKRPKVGNWQEIPANLCCNPTTTTTTAPLPLRMTFTDIAITEAMIGSTADDLAAWNVFFDLPALGSPFTSVSVVGNVVELFGGANIYLKDRMFDIDGVYEVVNLYNLNLIGFEDLGGVIIEVGYDSIGAYQNDGCTNLVNLTLPNCTQAGERAFSGTNIAIYDIPNLQIAGIACFQYGNIVSGFSNLITAGTRCFQQCPNMVSLDFPLLQSIGDFCFDGCNVLTTLSLPSLLTMGSSVLYDNVFGNIAGNTITLTVPIALSTCNTGQPDGDIQTFLTNNPLSTVVYV